MGKKSKKKNKSKLSKISSLSEKLSDTFKDLAKRSARAAWQYERAAEAMQIAASREELFITIASLSSIEFAQFVKDETSAEHNLYDIEKELDIQSKICFLLRRGISQEAVKSMVENRIVDVVYFALLNW